MRYYTITEAAAKLGINRNTVVRWVKTGKISAAKEDNKARSPYKISESEFAKIREESTPNTTAPTPTAVKPEVVREAQTIQAKPYRYEEFIEIQKILLETMRDLASTQEKIATTLAQLVKKT